MVARKLDVSKLKNLQLQWLNLGERHPLVFHACAVRDSLVFIGGSKQPGDGSEIGCYAIDVFNSADLRNETAVFPDVEFGDVKMNRKLRQSLYEKFWCGVAREVLKTLKRENQSTVFDFTPCRIACDDDRGWFGSCIFDRKWLGDPVPTRSYLGEVALLAAQSLVSIGHEHAVTDSCSSAMEPWMSWVYRTLNAPARGSYTLQGVLSQLPAATVTSDASVSQQVWDSSLFINVSVEASLMWLPCDIGTACAEAIESHIQSAGNQSLLNKDGSVSQHSKGGDRKQGDYGLTPTEEARFYRVARIDGLQAAKKLFPSLKGDASSLMSKLKKQADSGLIEYVEPRTGKKKRGPR